MKKKLILTVCISLGLLLTACTGNKTDSSSKNDVTDTGNTDTSATSDQATATTEDWIAINNTATGSYDESDTQDYTGVDNDGSNFIKIGQNKDGKDIYSLFRFPLKGTWLANEVVEARLYLKLKKGNVPATFRVGFVTGDWEPNDTTRTNVRTLVDDTSFISVSVQKEKDGWVSIPITDFVKTWLNADKPDYGIALFGEKAGEKATFVSGFAESESEIPYLKVSGVVSERVSDYGKFAYMQMPLSEESEESGNCFSFALRDEDMILSEDMAFDYKELTDIYDSSGEEGVLDYVRKDVINYVEADKDGLKISDFRQIENFDSEIDPSKEYRIALRVGCKVSDEVPDINEKNFDFHFWVQLNDGQWAQKFPQDISDKIPWSGPGISPEKYSWDAAIQWAEKFKNFYDSKIIYFAVTKDTDHFTKHKGK
ncbi:hypothetical protein FACS1894111_09200 [Clostridia bacterium]|nr:hypothetical protein FACS1894111_09200 [Clostridia bacterium]